MLDLNAGHFLSLPPLSEIMQQKKSCPSFPYIPPGWFRPIWVCWVYLGLGIWSGNISHFESTRAKHSVLPDSTTPNRDELHTQSLILMEFHLCFPSVQIWRLFLSQLFLYFQMLNVKRSAMGVKLSPGTQACKIHCLLYLYKLTWSLCPHPTNLKNFHLCLYYYSSSPFQYKSSLISSRV